MSSEEEVGRAVEAINIAIEGLPGTMHVSTHICQGNYAVGKEYDAQIGHRYFDTGRYKADLICKIECSSYLVEYDMTQHYQAFWATSRSASAPLTCRIPRWRAGIWWHRAFAPTLGSILSRQLSPARAVLTASPRRRRSESLRQWPWPRDCSVVCEGARADRTLR